MALTLVIAAAVELMHKDHDGTSRSIRTTASLGTSRSIHVSVSSNSGTRLHESLQIPVVSVPLHVVLDVSTLHKL